jgi:hypothetical protein
MIAQCQSFLVIEDQQFQLGHQVIDIICPEIDCGTAACLTE